jgi:hypothetical protein
MADENILELTFKEITTSNQLFCQFDDHHGVILLDVKNSFTAEDFKAISRLIDPYYEAHGELMGIIINSKKFPYWTSPENRSQYLNFAQTNHFKFKKAALVMGGFFTKIVVQIAKGRVHPEVKMFKYNRIEEAQSWILGTSVI